MSLALRCALSGPLAGIAGLVDHVRDYVGEFTGEFVVMQKVGNRDMLALPDGRIATRAGRDIIMLVNPKTGEQGATIPILALHWGVFGDQLATTSNDLTWRTWDLTTGLCTSQRLLTKYRNGFFASYDFCALTRKNQVALFGNGEMFVKVMDMSTGVYLYSLDKLQGTPTTAVCLPDGRLVVAVKHLMHVFDDDQFVCKLKHPSKAYVSKLITDGRWLLAKMSDGVFAVWDIPTLKMVRMFPSRLHVAIVNGQLVTADHTYMHIYRSAQDPEPYKTLDLDSVVTGLVTLPNCRLVSCHADGNVCVWR